MDIDLRLGRYQDVLADVECDCLIVDPPYSQRTEDGFRTGADLSARGLGYQAIDESFANAMVAAWHKRTRGWLLVFGDHISARWFETALQATGRYVFQPLPIVKAGAAPRLAGDGPASQCEWLMVARPRSNAFAFGSKPGWYKMQTVRHGHGWVGVSGAKSLDLMRALVRDYSRPGDLICDPCAGGGTTLLAAAIEGRRAVGAEMMPEHYEIAQRRFARGYTPTLFADQ